VQLIFPRKIIRTTPGSFRTRVLREGVAPSLHISYKQFDLKQYFKEGRALRTEGTFHDPCDFGVNKGLENMAYLKQLGRQINRRLLEVERVSHNCGLSAASIQRVVLPTVGKDGLRAPGLKFGDPRVMALMLALAMFGVVIAGFRNRELRRRVAALGELTPAQYSARQISYDLTRLRRKGLIFRAQGSHRYYPTPYGCKLARLYARLEVRVFRPALSAMQERVVEMPTPLQNALQGVDRHFDSTHPNHFPHRKSRLKLSTFLVISILTNA
jgi:hypothetical protein